MIRSIIVAASTNNVIGKDNDLAWKLPIDMNFFKETTKGYYVIMGRKNFESIPHKYRPLPNRENIIITRKKNYQLEGCLVSNSIKEALEIPRKNNENEAFIIGGGEIYKLALEQRLVDRVYLTRVHHDFEGDTFFPKLDNSWLEVSKKEFYKDEKHKYDFTFYIYEKKN